MRPSPTHRSIVRSHVVVLLIWTLAGALGLGPALLAGSGPGIEAELWGVSLGVSDVPASVSFYRDTLEMSMISQTEVSATLRVAELFVVLHHSERPAAPFGSNRTYLNLTVDDLDSAVRRIVETGGGVVPGGFADSAVGRAITMLDPDGHPFNLIDHPWDDDTPTDPVQKAFRLFNVGLRAHDKMSYEGFFASVGIGVRTRDYLPTTLVMERRGGAQIVVHDASVSTRPDQDPGRLLFVAAGPVAVAGLPGFVGAETGPRGSWIDLRSPSGTPARLFQGLREPAGGDP